MIRTYLHIYLDGITLFLLRSVCMLSVLGYFLRLMSQFCRPFFDVTLENAPQEPTFFLVKKDLYGGKLNEWKLTI